MAKRQQGAQSAPQRPFDVSALKWAHRGLMHKIQKLAKRRAGLKRQKLLEKKRRDQKKGGD